MAAVKAVRKPIRRSLLRGSALFLLTLVTALAIIAYSVVSSALYARYNAKLDDVLTYVEHNVDADDLAHCIETGVPTEAYDELQGFLNGMIDDLELEYLYIVVPSNDTMTNVISATSAEERAAGEDDMGLLETTDAYSPKELRRYLNCWDSNKISYFEETSGYGSYYTACKPLRDSQGNTVALLCADLSISALHRSIWLLFAGSFVAAVVLFGAFGVVVARWLDRNITDPVLELERSAREFASASHDAQGVERLEFTAPSIHTGNEIEALGTALTKMALDIQAHVRDTFEAQRRAVEVERRNAELAKDAEAARKIAELSESVTSLFINMPGLTFSKDAKTGVYLACNQAFAEYAHKETPDGVIGLTDHQIFDEVTASHFEADDQRALSMDEPYVFFEDVYDAAGNPKQFQTTKMKFYDTTGRLCTLGMCVDVTELMSARRDTIAARRAYEVIRDESITYYSIARALSVDYLRVYYVDANTGSYVTYRHDHDGDNLTLGREGQDFFAFGRQIASRQVYGADLDMFLEVFTKEGIVGSIEEQGAFSLTYRAIVDGNPTYMNLRATYAQNDEGHIVVGISNVDAQTRHREAARRIREERVTYARISALSGDYLAIYTVDPDTDRYVEYSATQSFRSLVNFDEGSDFFRDAREVCERIAHPADMDMIRGLLVKERVMSEVISNGLFVMTFRMLLEGAPTYVSLRAGIVEESDGPQLIVGISNVDAQVKRDKEFAVAQNRANRDALTGVKNKHAYVDAEQELDARIASGADIEFALVVCDINNLKQTNDERGHQAGDDLIKQACAIICDVFKHSPVFRVGGDEFVAILQGHDYRSIDDLVREIDASNRRNVVSGGAVIAMGFSAYDGDENVAAVFSRADSAMYHNKKALKGA